MVDALEIAGVALTAFASTNLDNLLLLTLLLGQKQQSRLAVFLGYVGSVSAIAIVGLVVARLADTLPADWLGYLGLVPLGMGLYRLTKLVGRSDADGRLSKSNAALGAASVAALTFANGADTLGVLLPLFAETSESLSFVLAVVIVAAAMLWVAMSKWISGQPWVRRPLARAERWLVPALLILVGLYILLNSPTDTVPGQSFSIDDDLG